MKEYNVTIPVAGHVYLTIEADSPEDAVDKAMEADIGFDDLGELEMLGAFHSGNICYCPSPWKAGAEEVT